MISDYVYKQGEMGSLIETREAILLRIQLFTIHNALLRVHRFIVENYSSCSVLNTP